MEADFWHKKWESNIIGFHVDAPNPLLVNNLASLALKPASRLFLPLCGKTLDIGWLLSQGYQVAGAELSTIAVDQLFEQLNLKPTVTNLGELMHYQADNIDIFAGDIFQLTAQQLGVVDAIYDRAALVALPADMRVRYATHLMQLTTNAPQLVVTFEYDQSQLAGPPFAISQQELHQHYGQAYEMTLVASEALEGGLKGQCEAIENVWVLKS